MTAVIALLEALEIGDASEADCRWTPSTAHGPC